MQKVYFSFFESRHEGFGIHILSKQEAEEEVVKNSDAYGCDGIFAITLKPEDKYLIIPMLSEMDFDSEAINEIDNGKEGKDEDDEDIDYLIKIPVLEIEVNQAYYTDYRSSRIYSPQELKTLQVKSFQPQYKIYASELEALAQNIFIETLGLNVSEIGPDGAIIISSSRSITDLNLSGNKIRDRGAEALSRNNILKRLDLDSNEIGPAGAEALSRNTSLNILGLQYNNIGDRGAEALSRNTTLTSLDVFQNSIGVQGVEALKQNTTLIPSAIDLRFPDVHNTALVKIQHVNSIFSNIVSKMMHRLFWSL